MARRRKKKSGFEQILDLSWREQLIFAAMAAGGAILIPFFVGTHPLLVPLSRLFASLAWVFSAVLLAVAAIKFAIERRRAPGAAIRETTLEPAAVPMPVMKTEGDSGHVSPVDESWRQSMVKPTPALDDKPKAWSFELLRELEWKRFEVLCGTYYEKRGFRVETIARGADGGIDAKLYYGQIKEPVGLVQCKAWSSRPVGVKTVRELLGVMVHNKVAKGILHASGSFSSEALEFARANKIQLIGGAELLANIEKLAADIQNELLALATEGDYKTPTCPSCGIKMRRVPGKHGDFWGCTNFPRCKVKWSVTSGGMATM